MSPNLQSASTSMPTNYSVVMPEESLLFYLITIVSMWASLDSTGTLIGIGFSEQMR